MAFWNEVEIEIVFIFDKKEFDKNELIDENRKANILLLHKQK